MNKFADGNNIKKDKPKIMWSSSPLPKNNKTKVAKYRNSPSKKANFKLPGLATYRKQHTQLLIKKAINKTKNQPNTSVVIKQELIDSTINEIYESKNQENSNNNEEMKETNQNMINICENEGQDQVPEHINCLLPIQTCL